MTIEQEQKCAIEALSRASDVTQRLMFREGAKWMDSEHAAALAKAEERCRVLETALRAIESYDQGNGCCPYGCDTPSIARRALEGK